MDWWNTILEALVKNRLISRKLVMVMIGISALIINKMPVTPDTIQAVLYGGSQICIVVITATGLITQGKLDAQNGNNSVGGVGGG